MLNSLVFASSTILQNSNVEFEEDVEQLNEVCILFRIFFLLLVFANIQARMVFELHHQDTRIEELNAQVEQLVRTRNSHSADV